MNEKLYICGDSFCSTDKEYGDNWPEILEKSCASIDVVNLSSFGASNYLIYKQVQYALEQQCDYLIYNATSAIRQEFVIKEDYQLTDNIHRYYNINQPNQKKPMACISWLNPDKNAAHFFDKAKINKIKDFFNEFIDMPVLVEKNYIFIKSTLQLITSNKNLKGWAWSIGGFEHKAFSNISNWDFQKYKEFHTDINLWDYYDPKVKRPYYHVSDRNILQQTSLCYIKKLKL